MRNALIFLMYSFIFICCNAKAQVSLKFDSIVMNCGISKSNITKKSNDELLKVDIKPTKSKIIINYFRYKIKNDNYDKIDSLISINYKKAIILQRQRIPQVYGLSFQYIIKYKNGLYYHDNYVLKLIDNENILFYYSSIFGQYNKDEDIFECILQAIKNKIY